MLWGTIDLAAVGAAVSTMLVLHLLPTGLSPVSDAVSRYGISHYRAGYRVLTLSMAVAGAAVVAGLPGALSGRPVATVVGLVAVFGVSRAAISWFPMDEPGTQPPSGHARVHGILALATFASVTAAALRLSRLLDVDQQWVSTAGWLRWLGWYLAAGVLATLFAVRSRRPGRSLFGLVERALYAGVFGWLAVVGVSLLTG